MHPITLTMYRGLPASGKTTAAEQACAQRPNLVRISKDDIRAARVRSYPHEVWTPDVEMEIVLERDRLIKDALALGHDVISDDTNYNPVHELRLKKIAREYAATFEVRDFYTHVDECVRRDRVRLRPIGEKVIRDMHARYVAAPQQAPPPRAAVYDATLPYALICDLDGTLALSDGRRDWHDHAACDHDDCNLAVHRTLEVYYRFMDDRIVYLTGREERYRPQTETFLTQWQCPPGVTLMRQNGDRRPNAEVKADLFEAHVRGHYNVRFALDDDSAVIAMYRARGVQAWQVA